VPNHRLIRIAGAGPSGLAAAIILARAGREVEVHEAKRDVGTRFIGDLQIIEGASESEPVPAFLDRLGIERNFYFRAADWATFYDHKSSARVIRSKEPYGWFIHRGAEEGTLDRGLLAQAQRAGANVIFNSRLAPDQAGIVATGPASPDGLAKEMTWRVGSAEWGVGSGSETADANDAAASHTPPPTPHPLPKNHIPFVSTIEPRKNLEVLLDAFARLRARGAYDGALVVVGRVGWKSESLIPRLRAPGVHHLDYVPPTQLASIYRNAELFVFPSIYEGFGFPLLEAMAYGIPSIAARSSSLPEIGGDAALYFSPRNAVELESQMERALTDAALRAQLSAAGIARAAQFRWDVAAEQTLAVLRRSAERT
jgi:glycosyltransferase involved in cell wall biosynthesis